MGDQYRLAELGNSQLLARLSALVRQSNVLTAQVLAHLVELEERSLPEELGYPSLFAYCVDALKMSEAAAGRRVTAARMCRRFPEAFACVARGELHLCALCALTPHVTPENSSELFDACRGKTRRKIEELLAARFPRPDVREQIRRLPVRAQVTATVASEPTEPSSPSSIAVEVSTAPATPPEVPRNSLDSTSSPVVAPPSAPGSDMRRRAREIEPLSADRFGVHFTADAELRDLIERARALASHKLPNGDLAGLMKLMAAFFVQQEEKRRFGIGTRPRRVKPKAEPKTGAETNAQSVDSAELRTPPGGVSAPVAPTETTTREAGAGLGRTGKRGRHVPVTVKREAYTRDGGRCSFVSTTGRRCMAQAFIQLDHVTPFARLGGADVRNMRLLCRAHNLLHARRCFGVRHIKAKIARKRVNAATRAKAK